VRYEGLRLEHETARTRLHLAGALGHVGLAERARNELERARQSFKSMRAQRDLERAERLLEAMV